MAQDVQAEAAAAEKRPAEHAELQAAGRPVAELYFPAAQLVQLDDEVDAWYFPTAHDVHAEAPVAEYWPFAQASEQAVLRPMAPLYFPAAQLVQLVEPVAVWYFPA